MRRLMLLRHAKAERSLPGEQDRERGLLERGRKEASLIGGYIVTHALAPDGVLVSPAIRTQQTLLVIGHNPGLHELAGLLIASGDVQTRERLSEKLPTSGLVIVDFAIDEWARLHPHSGRLERFVTPKSLETGD